LLVDYVFVLPNKLSRARARIETDVDATIEGVH